MLDAETKRKIDNCRDVLVGKIPDPKSQVEQITIALIYKFMDDMDQLSVYQGGKPSFFRDEFEKYSWSSIFDRRLGGQEILNLYGEALVKMNQNPNIPQLFRDIFKNAFLPYRDPETLRLFLKEISGFTYDHSERLGDAFEYLLSVLSSQGDAGQFRTPRHIIDFIVKIVDPQLNETVLDPACGTAGFLISAYKHITRNNPKLSNTQKQRLMGNFVGYDISYDMVRLSLVNMYLHGFANPKIHEYDTLTYEDKWSETFDVIMANPPFMSPKGGIRPHSRFSIKANRSEVLFVDYIAEHLNPSGRAAIIVPEGIIFISQNAYKRLRKMLIENYLWAVVSLPAGVFNPYSGTKTCILLMDKSLAKRIDQILFVKIESDGYDLGAQRRPIDKNDLPPALKFLNTYKSKIGNLSNLKSEILNPQSDISPFAHVVPKSQIAKSGDFNLSGDRYRSFQQHISTYPVVELGSVAIIGAGNSAPQDEKYFKNGCYPFFRTSDVGGVHVCPNLCTSNDKINQEAVSELGLTLFPKETILFPKSGASTFLNHRVMIGLEVYVSSHLATINCDKTKLLPKFAFYLLCNVDAKNLTENQNYPSLRLRDIETIKIPLPPLDVQEKIVAEIDGYQKIIDGARQIVENYKPTFKINPAWPMVPMEKVLRIDAKITQNLSDYADEYYIGADNIEPDTGRLINPTTISKKRIRGPAYRFKKGQILYSKLRPYLNKATIIGFAGFCSADMYPLSVNQDSAKPEYVLTYILSPTFMQSIKDFYARARMPKINKKQLYSLKMPLPSLSDQQQIVSQIEAEQKIVNENKKLIEIFQNKISDKIADLWGR